MKILRAVRAPFFTASIVPILLGGVEAARYLKGVGGSFDFLLFFLALIGGLCFHASANVMNDYFDNRGGTDNINRYHNPFSGGSRLIQDGVLTPRETLNISLFYLFLGTAIGIYLLYRTGPLLLIFGLSGIFFALAYSVDRFGLSYIGRGLGDLTIGLSFGPIMLLGTYYVLTLKPCSPSTLLLSVPVALLIALVLFINGYPDYDADRATGKHSGVVSLGRKKASYAYLAMVAATYLSVILGVVFKIIPPFTLLSLLTLPLAVKAVSTLFKVYEDPVAVVQVCGMTVGLHLITGLLLAVGIGIHIFI
jgi:1,4-dihydroxy-2-naphthoate octaprenyltransferase